MIIGLGSGRCGTNSLAVLLDSQEGVKVTHEETLLSWQYDRDDYNAFNDSLSGREEATVGDVAFYHLNYCEMYLKQGAICICLQRNREETINSYINWIALNNGYGWFDPSDFDGIWEVIRHRSSKHWRNSDHLKRCYPNLEGKFLINKLAAYYDLYYKKANELAEHENFRIFDIDKLNHKETQLEILTFAQIENPQTKTIKLNES